MKARFALLLVAMLALAAPPLADAARPDIDRVVVSRDGDGVLRFRIAFGSPLVAPDEDANVQVAIDADRDYSTGVDGLEYSLDKSGGWFGDPFAVVDDPDDNDPYIDDPASLALLTAVDGEPVESHPRRLRFSHEGNAWPDGIRSVTFSVPASVIGDPRRFDFYVFIRSEGHLDEAPSHVLFSAGAAPWTYPRDGTPAASEAYLTETYFDNPDVTLSERPGLFIAVVVFVLVFGGLLAVGGWGVQRLRKRTASRP
jgi:hypothetical protein